MGKTNAQMCELVVARRQFAIRDGRIAELEKMLRRAQREIETLQAQVGDNQSDHLLAKIQMVLDAPMKEVY